MVNKREDRLFVRAEAAEIFDHLRDLSGEEAIKVCHRVSTTYSPEIYKEAIELLKEFDATLGGIGIYLSKGGKKLPGIYRGLSYNEIPLRSGNARDLTRIMILGSGAYLEELIKKWRRLSFIEKVRDSHKNGIPLGGLISKVRPHVPVNIYHELVWLNSRVHVYVKHRFDLEEERVKGMVPEHYFLLEEAIAVYFIVRILGTKMEELSGLKREAFLDGWDLP